MQRDDDVAEAELVALAQQGVVAHGKPFAVDEGPVLTPQIRQRRLGRGERQPSVPAREAGEVEPDVALLTATDQMLAGREPSLFQAPCHQAAHRGGGGGRELVGGFAGAQCVTEPTYRPHQAPAAAGVADRTPDFGHRNRDRPVADEGVRPQRVEDLLAGYRARPLLRQQLEQREGLGSQVNRFAAAPQLAGVEIQLAVAKP